MIQAVFYHRRGLLTGYTVQGHSGSAARGQDIVCAAVSSAVYLTANSLTEIMHKRVRIRQADGFLEVLVCDPGQDSETVLRGLELHLKSLSGEYPDYIRVIEKRRNQAC